MKKIFKSIGTILLILLIAIIIFLIYLSKRPAAPTDYQAKTKTGGELEAHYMANGSYEVSSYEQSVLQGFGKYLLYYLSIFDAFEQSRSFPLSDIIGDGFFLM